MEQNQEPNQEQQNLSSSKKFLPNPKLPLIAATIVIILTVGVILLWQQLRTTPPLEQPTTQQISPPAPSPQPINNQQSTVDTSNWQTYRNEEFGFEVRYPRDWSITGETTGQPAFSPDGKVKIYTRLHVSGTPEYMYARAHEDDQECPERKEPMFSRGAACPLVKTKETKEVTINGISGYFKERESGSFSAYLPRPDKKIAIELTTQHSDYKDIFTQILSTFRFTP